MVVGGLDAHVGRRDGATLWLIAALAISALVVLLMTCASALAPIPTPSVAPPTVVSWDSTWRSEVALTAKPFTVSVVSAHLGARGVVVGHRGDAAEALQRAAVFVVGRGDARDGTGQHAGVDGRAIALALASTWVRVSPSAPTLASVAPRITLTLEDSPTPALPPRPRAPAKALMSSWPCASTTTVPSAVTCARARCGPSRRYRSH